MRRRPAIGAPSLRATGRWFPVHLHRVLCFLAFGLHRCKNPSCQRGFRLGDAEAQKQNWGCPRIERAIASLIEPGRRRHGVRQSRSAQHSREWLRI